LLLQTQSLRPNFFRLANTEDMKKIALLIALSACASGYKPRGSSGNGYTETQMGDNVYMISFYGNGWTSSADARTYNARRAGELCAEKGFRTFKLINAAEDNSDITISCVN